MGRFLAWLRGIVGAALIALGFLVAADFARAQPFTELGTGAWSWFGGPRAVSDGDKVFTGWITNTGTVVVAEVNLSSGAHVVTPIHFSMVADDHSNPSLHLRPDGHVAAFYSPHSGRRREPQFMAYRVSTAPHSVAAFGPESHVTTNAPGRLGWTYPTILSAGGQTWLFWRGGSWQPTYSTTRDYANWSPARVLLHGPPGHRPYAKYEARGATISMAFTEAHPGSRDTSLYYARMEDGWLRRADGRRVARLGSDPSFRRFEVIYRRRSPGRAWVHDVAMDAQGRPVVLYAVILSARDHRYRYAAWDGGRWRDRELATAGPALSGNPTYSAGAALDYADPSIAYLSRFDVSGGRYELERWEKRGGWRRRPVTGGSSRDNLRPVVPRGLPPLRAVLWLQGFYASYRDLASLRVRMSIK